VVVKSAHRLKLLKQTGGHDIFTLTGPTTTKVSQTAGMLDQNDRKWTRVFLACWLSYALQL